MPSREPGPLARNGKPAGLSAHHQRQEEMVAAGNGVGVTRKKKAIDQELPLKKSGERWPMKIARGWEGRLRDLLEEYPDHFRALVSLVEGHPENVTDQQFHDLHKLHYLRQDRTPLPGARAIIEAAYRQTPDGPAIVDSIDAKTPEDAAIFRKAQRQMDKLQDTMIDRIIKRLIKDDQKDQGWRH